MIDSEIEESSIFAWWKGTAFQKKIMFKLISLEQLIQVKKTEKMVILAREGLLISEDPFLF